MQSTGDAPGGSGGLPRRIRRLRSIEGERYRDFEVVGRGGMGVVYVALDREMNRRVAFKMVTPDPHAPKGSPAPDDPCAATPPAESETEKAAFFQNLSKRFLQEAWVTGAMEHPGVVPVYELGETEAGIPFYTMRYVRGERTLADAIAAARETDARLALVDPFLRICDTIRYAHARGVIHRDLKPENIALGEFGEVIVLDWGLAKSLGQQDLSDDLWQERIEEFRAAADLRTVAGALGTPGYMAPEAALGQGELVDERSDVYSLGAILYELLTGRLPVPLTTYGEYVRRLLNESPESPATLDAGVPEELSAICMEALARDRESRLADVATLAQRLRRWQTEGTVDRQVEALVEHAASELGSTDALQGTLLMLHLDRASALCNRVLHLRPQDADALALMAEVKRLREGGIRQRVRGDRRRVLYAVAASTLLMATVAALILAGIRSREREVTEARVRTIESEARLRIAERDASWGEQLALRETAVAKAERAELEARGLLAASFEGLARRALIEGRVAPARLAALRAVEAGPGLAAWRAFAEADSCWSPSLRATLAAVAPVTAMAFDPEGNLLYCAGADGAIREVDCATGETRRHFQGLLEEATLLAISPATGRLYAGGVLGRVYGWDREANSFLGALPAELVPRPDEKTASGVLPFEGVAVRSLLPHGEPEMLIAGYADGKTRGWGFESARMLASFSALVGEVTALASSEDGRAICAGTSTGEVMLFRFENFFRHEVLARLEQPIVGLGLSEDGEEWYVWSKRHDVMLVSGDGEATLTAFRTQAPAATAIHLTRDRRRLVAAERSGVLRLWDIAENRLLCMMDLDARETHALALSGDDRFLAHATAGGNIRLWDLQGLAEESQLQTLVLGDGALRVHTRPDHAIEVVGARALELRGHTRPITLLCANEANDRLASASLDGTVRLWDLIKGEQTELLTGLTHPATALAFDESSDRLLFATLAGTVESWDAQQRRRAVLPITLELPATALGTSPGGETLAVATLDGAVQLVRMAGGEVTTRFDAAAPPLALVVASLGSGVRVRTAQGGGEWTLGGGYRPAIAEAAEAAAGHPWLLQPLEARRALIERQGGLRLEGLEFRPTPPSSAPEPDRDG